MYNSCCSLHSIVAPIEGLIHCAALINADNRVKRAISLLPVYALTESSGC